MEDTERVLRSAVMAAFGHELRTPLNGILGFAEILQTEMESISLQQRSEYCSYILKSAKRLKQVSEKVSTWFELSQTCVPHIQTSFSFTPEYVLAIAEAEAAHYLLDGNLFHFSTESFQCHVAGSSEQIRLALKELINNAFKFSSAGELVSINIIKRHDHIIIKIKNASVVTTVDELISYQPFTQFNRKIYEQQGLGLGLEIARLGLTQSGGTLNIVQGETCEENCIVVEAVLPISIPYYTPGNN